MSRLIVKNLPDKIKENRIREVFSCQGGEITDVKLCFTKKGVFRKFAFIGYKNEPDADVALKFLNQTFIDTNKIQVEVCKNLGDLTVPRPWSKYAKESSAFLRKSKDIDKRKERIRNLQEEKTEKKKEKKKKSRVFDELADVNDDPEFQEFLFAHLNKSVKSTWTNETAKDMNANKEEENSDVEKEECDERKNMANDDDHSDNETKMETPAMEKKCSDLDWLKSKTTKTKGESSSQIETTSTSSRCERHEDSSEYKSTEKGIGKKSIKQVDNQISSSSCTIRMRGIPFKSTEQDIIKFFEPLTIEDIRFRNNTQGKRSGYAFVDFANPKDALEALTKDQSTMNERYVELFLVHNKKDDEDIADRKWNKSDRKEDEESLADTGRLFVRNLSFGCIEDDLHQLFSQIGPLVEVNMPVDKDSNKCIGIAFVTFMMPEHAVKALSELDGTIFQGRILHLLPGKAKRTKELTGVQGTMSSYKRNKEEEQKKLSSNTHNWNALFLGQNAVADVMAARLDISKHGLLDVQTEGSVAVRMALGETELVSETRKFLESNGVKLDVFGQANSARSKNVILAKNLPSGTTANELKEIFEKYGDVVQVLMPPFGITAIIEFNQGKNAKEAFSNLAYSKFKHIPLYLEWAPVDILSGEVTVKEEDKIEDEDEDENSDENDEISGNTLFVKNLNFITTEDTLRQRFVSCGKLKNVTVARKKDIKKPGVMLSMGYGFIEYNKSESADKAIKLLQHCDIDGHKVELKKSHRENLGAKSSRKRTLAKKQTGSKIIVRNIPFEATSKEIKELFSSFGTLKTVRLPKKMAGTGSHRGFAFVDFTSKQEAKRAFKALCQSTHLYGRRLVLEWAEEEDSVDALRHKTAEHFHESGERSNKKRKTDILDSLEHTSQDE